MRRIAIILLLLAAFLAAYWMLAEEKVLPKLTVTHEVGDARDSLHGVIVFHNDGMNATHGRNVVDGYNVGLKYQCVEFVKRYYLEHYHHRMPDSYGHAKDLFDPAVDDGALNERRALLQFTNPSASKPEEGDLVVLDGWPGNPYGHVAIVSKVEDGEVEVVQQNTGSTRNSCELDMIDGRWRVENKRVLGWLRMR